jgi:Response regulator of the LytR/AlgR family
MLRIAICDDERLHLDAMKQLIEEHLYAVEQDFTLSSFNSASDFLQTFEPGKYNIVILDIVMPEQTGLELSQKIFDEDKNCVIAFLTSSPDYAIMGYGVNAVAYMLKPPTKKKVGDLLDTCIARIRKKSTRHLFVKTGTFNQKIDLARTIYMESKNKQVLVHTDNETIIYNGKLSDLLTKLPESFVQIHKSYIINLFRVKAMRRNCMISDREQSIPISRQFQKEASNRYFTHLESFTD